MKQEFVTLRELSRLTGKAESTLRHNIHLLLGMVIQNGYSIKKDSPFMVRWDGKEKAI